MTADTTSQLLPSIDAEADPQKQPGGELPAELIAQLRDIRLPEPVTWWPPAAGWWIVAIVALCAVASLWYIFGQRAANQILMPEQAVDQARRRLHSAFEQWQRDQCFARYADVANILLKSLAIAEDRRTEVAALHTCRWGLWLSRHMTMPPSKQVLEALCIECYRPGLSLSAAQVHRELLVCLDQPRVFHGRHATGDIGNNA